MANLISRGLFSLFFGGRRRALGGTLPGPDPGVLGTAGDFLGGTPPWQVCARYGREYGGVTLIWMVGNPGLVLNDPAVIEQVLVSRRMEFEKGSINDQIRPSVTDHSIFIAKQSDWADMRRADPFEQPWSDDWLADQVRPMQASVAASVDALIAKGDASIDLVPALRRLTFDAFTVAMIGETGSDQAYDDWLLLAKAADDRIQAKLPLRFVSPPKGFEAVKARFFGAFIERVRAARKSPKEGAVDLMSRTLREMPDTSDEALGHILALSYFGGVFSSTTTLVGAFHQLQKHPDADARLAAEAADLARGELTLERVRGARWVEAVTLEAMRLLPPVRLMTRTPARDTQIAGITLPAGSMIMISNQHLHRDPSRWRDADTFDPARWLDGGVERDPLGSGYFFPFGRGPRVCVAWVFGMGYLLTALATIAARAKVQVDSTEPFEEGFFFGVVLPKGVTGRFVARGAAAST